MQTGSYRYSPSEATTPPSWLPAGTTAFCITAALETSWALGRAIITASTASCDYAPIATHPLPEGCHEVECLGETWEKWQHCSLYVSWGSHFKTSLIQQSGALWTAATSLKTVHNLAWMPGAWEHHSLHIKYNQYVGTCVMLYIMSCHRAVVHGVTMNNVLYFFTELLPTIWLLTVSTILFLKYIGVLI